MTAQSKLLRPIDEEKSNLIHEERIYSNYFVFPREFVYLRHIRRQNERFIIIDKSVDAIDV